MQVLRPHDPARGGVERDELAGPGGHVEPLAVRRGARVEALVAHDAPLHVGAPELGAVRAAQAEDRARVGRDADAVPPDGRARVDPAARVVGPADRARRHVDREQAAVGGAEVGDVVRDDRGGLDPGRGLDRPEGPAGCAVEPETVPSCDVTTSRGPAMAGVEALGPSRRVQSSRPVRASIRRRPPRRLGVHVQPAVAEAGRVLHQPPHAFRPDRLLGLAQIDVEEQRPLRVAAELLPATLGLGSRPGRGLLLRRRGRLERLGPGGGRHGDAPELGVELAFRPVVQAQRECCGHAGGHEDESCKGEEELFAHGSMVRPRAPEYALLPARGAQVGIRARAAGGTTRSGRAPLSAGSPPPGRPRRARSSPT